MQSYLPGHLQVISVSAEDKTPKIICDPAHEELVLPDTHGNVAGIIHKLQAAGVMTIPQENLKDIEDLLKLESYEQHTEDTLKKFDTLLNSATFETKQYKKLRFLGDMLADRAGNDWFTLKFLEKLVEKNIKFEINLSNHDLEFLRYYRLVKKGLVKKEISKKLFSTNIDSHQSPSLYIFIAMYQKMNLIETSQIIDLVERCYLPFLKLPQVTFDEEKYCEQAASSLKPQAIMYTHAPCGTEITQALHKQFCNLPTVNPETVIDLMDAHDSIQESFQEELKKDTFWERNTITHSMQDNRIDYDSNGIVIPDPTQHPLEYITWNRYKQYISCSKNYELTVIHGHVGKNTGAAHHHQQTWQLENVKGHNLDDKNEFGKSLYSSFGEYTVYTSPSYIPSFKKLHNALQKRKDEKESKSGTIVMDDPIDSAGMILYESAKNLLKFFMKNNLRAQYKTVKDAITIATKAIEDPKVINATEAINNSIMAVSQLEAEVTSSIRVKKYITRIIGALCVIAGGCVLAAGVFGIPFSLGISIGLAAGLGSGLIAFGLAMISKSFYYPEYKLNQPCKLFSKPLITKDSPTDDEESKNSKKKNRSVL